MDRLSFFLTGGPTSVLHTEQKPPPPIYGQGAEAIFNFRRLYASVVGGRRCALRSAMIAVLAAAGVLRAENMTPSRD